MGHTHSSTAAQRAYTTLGLHNRRALAATVCELIELRNINTLAFLGIFGEFQVLWKTRKCAKDRPKSYGRPSDMILNPQLSADNGKVFQSC